MFVSPSELSQAALEHRVDVLTDWLLGCTVGIAIGVIIEVTGELVPKAGDRVKKRLHWIEHWAWVGGVVIVLSLTAEFYVEFSASRAESALRQIADDNLAQAIREVGDAKASATVAHTEANAVAQKASSISARLNAASTQLDSLERQTLPKWRLLQRGHSQFIEALKPFAGQRVTIVRCGQEDARESLLEDGLVNLFHDAGWQQASKPWPGCTFPLSVGNGMFFVLKSRPPQRRAFYYDSKQQPVFRSEGGVAAAAKALCDALNKLEIDTFAIGEVVPQSSNNALESQWARYFYGMGTPGSPAELAFEEPTTIFFQIGPE